MNKTKEKFVLAFFPNPLGFGFAFMQNALNLKDYQMVKLRPVNNKATIKRIKEYIEYYEPDIVVVEDYLGKQSRKSQRIQKLIDCIIACAKDKNIEVRQYAREQIRFVFSEFKAKTKYEISKVITENIPELKKLIKPQRKLWESEPYAQGIFDAVSLGITHYFLTE